MSGRDSLAGKHSGFRDHGGLVHGGFQSDLVTVDGVTHIVQASHKADVERHMRALDHEGASEWDVRQVTARATIAQAVRMLLAAVGENPDREGLSDTPDRVARAWLQDLCSGYGCDPEGYLDRTFPPDGYGGIVLVRDIPVVSLCEHHLLPFTGVCHVAYIPGDRIAGLSKFARVVNGYARRLQVQERLTVQVADCIERKLAPKGVLVTVAAEHSCMTIRGVQKPGTLTVTSEVRGVFKESESAKAEVFQLLREERAR